MVSHSRLKALLDYDKYTGIFVWKIDRNQNVKAGMPAGCINANGYVEITIDGKKYKGHILAWLFIHGVHPIFELDHKNKIKHDNRFNNLRQSTRHKNMMNIDNRKDTSSGVKGVTFFKRYNKWQPNIRINGKRYGLGYYENFDDAVCARLAAEQCLGWTNINSESPAYRHVKKIVSHII